MRGYRRSPCSKTHLPPRDSIQHLNVCHIHFFCRGIFSLNISDLGNSVYRYIRTNRNRFIDPYLSLKTHVCLRCRPPTRYWSFELVSEIYAALSFQSTVYLPSLSLECYFRPFVCSIAYFSRSTAIFMLTLRVHRPTHILSQKRSLTTFLRPCVV